MDERRFPRSIGALDGVFAYIADFLKTHGIDSSHSFDLDLIAEELFTNMVKYGVGRTEIGFGLALQANEIVLRLRDFDAEPFDVTRPRERAQDQPLQERKAGGLGLHLVQRLADQIDYHHEGRVSTVTVRRRLDR